MKSLRRVFSSVNVKPGGNPMMQPSTRRGWLLAAGLGLVMSMSAWQAEEAQAQVTTRTFAVVSSIGSPCYDLESKKVKYLFVTSDEDRTMTVTSHPISSLCGGESLAGATFHESSAVIGLPRGRRTSQSLWFLDDQPAPPALAIPRADGISYSCYATKDTYGELHFSSSASGMSWLMCFYVMDFWEF